ncbi:MAG: tetratricopeptide repeat protein [Robiginitomaculum sp.]|nr:tetratricopeptide repeat protein [Robiginitomaculum sp.]
MSDVFNEVDEELRKEVANRLFRKFLPLIIIVVVLIVGGVAGYQANDWWQTKQKSEAAEAYTSAAKLLEEGNYQEALIAFRDFAATGPKGYAALSKMQAAIATMKMGKNIEAATLFTEAAKDMDDPLFSDLATIKSVMIVFDLLTLTDLEAKLSKVSGAGRPYRSMARELLAFKAMEDGDLDRAREEFTLLSFSLDAPSGTAQRAKMALSLLGPAPAKVKPEPIIIPEPDLTPDNTLEDTN